MIEFRGFPKIPRLSRDITISEKIDGTNASILIADDGPITLGSGRVVPFLAGSRTRWILPEGDNHGFARWAYEHEDLIMALGPGHHYGEWWGQKIQRGYGLTEKIFSLFNVAKWGEQYNSKEGPIRTVPVLFQGLFTMEAVDVSIDILRTGGSFAAPGFKPAEGIVIYHSASNGLFKKTLVDDEKPKTSEKATKDA